MTSGNQKGRVDNTSEAVAAGTGGVAGAAAGAAVGSLVGPIGTIIGGLAGAVGGWWSGRAIVEGAQSYTQDDEDYYRTHYMQRSSTAGRGSTSANIGAFDNARPAYQLGHLAGVNPDYRQRSFDEVEPDLSRAYMSAGRNDWNDVRDYARDAYSRGRDVGEQRLTLSEEELRVGKRTVQAGEVALHKSVETEHVSETVPLMREEVTIERRAVTGSEAMSGDIQIGEDEIRIPLMAEEAVVDKRVVGTEEVVVRKHQVTENETVEADLRRERLEMNEDARTLTGDRTLDDTGSGMGGTTDRARDLRSGSGLADRVADTADDLKDRVDGNPASRPGRDATDRPGR
ncbi:MAG: YsnF/AvaK domain-containing protein [Gemmatimonadota bacterium]